MPRTLCLWEPAAGKSAIAWYRGPFVSGPSGIEAHDHEPVRKPGALLRYNAKLGMDDVSYAAAWELGRLLLLQNKSVSVALYNWKRCCHQEACLDKTCHETAHLPCRMPKRRFDFPREWFENLARLKGVPFNYLVPDERMLPRESIRFFQIDSFWVGCLIDGAFSIGSVGEKECCLFDGKKNEVLDGLPVTLSCFLLRSDVVAMWPSLEIDGCDRILSQDDEMPTKKLPQGKPVSRLSKNVLLCLFEGLVKTVDIHLPPEVLHFGVNDKDQDIFNNISASSELASQMLESVPRVRFVTKSA